MAHNMHVYCTRMSETLASVVWANPTLMSARRATRIVAYAAAHIQATVTAAGAAINSTAIRMMSKNTRAHATTAACNLLPVVVAATTIAIAIKLLPALMCVHYSRNALKAGVPQASVETLGIRGPGRVGPVRDGNDALIEHATQPPRGSVRGDGVGRALGASPEIEDPPQRSVDFQEQRLHPPKRVVEALWCGP